MPFDRLSRYSSPRSAESSTPACSASWLPGIQMPAPDQAVVPPTWSAFSKTATGAPSTAAASAAVSPAAPEPSTTTS